MRAGMLAAGRAGLGVFAMMTVLLAAPSVGAAATFTVNSTGDPGAGTCDPTECTLREAISAANAAAGTDTVAFSILAPPTIKPVSALPVVTGSAIIDGTTQPGFSGKPLVEVDGSLAGSADGLTIRGGSSTVRALAINRFGFPRAGILVDSLGGNRIEGNFIGTDVTGTIAKPNGVGLRIEGFDGAGNTIGGTSAAARNVISGNGYGAFIRGTAAGGNLIQGNYIGTDAAGAAAVGNSNNGIAIENTSMPNTIGGTVAGARNVISGNGGVGVRVDGASGNLVQGNYIGTDVGGSIALGNAFGVAILDEAFGSTNVPASNNVVGGSTPAARNVISANTGQGVTIGVNIGFSPQGEQNVVRGNYIGTDASGTADLGNQSGVQIQGPNNTIGGTSAADRNVISGNDGSGIFLAFDVAHGNKIQGNFIGTDAGGTDPLGNSGDGVTVFDGVNNAIGGSASGAGNVIAFNAGGVQVGSGTGNSILRNSTHSNAALAIDLAPYGVTPNDTGDPDSGPNDVQNFPVLTGASSGSGTTTIQGTLNSTPNTTFRVEFFESPGCDPAGSGEGKTFLGSKNVTTDASGNTSVTTIVPTGTSSGDAITATATDPASNTSEFSACATSTAAYPRPKGASPTWAPLVVAYDQCTAANGTHAPPLGFPSCNPGSQSSSRLTVGTPDANVKTARSSGFARYIPLGGDPSTPADEADVRLSLDLTDVFRRSGLSDYTGELNTTSPVRLTDRRNGPSANESGTMDFEFSYPVPCTATPGTEGATCSIDTTVEAVTPGAISEGARSIWELGAVTVEDGGADEVAATRGDNSAFMRQGIFVP